MATRTVLQSVLLLVLFDLWSVRPSVAADSSAPDSIAERFIARGLHDCPAYGMLQELTQLAPHRLSGSRDAAVALDLAGKMLARVGAVNIRAESLMVPHWERGSVEKAAILSSGRRSRTPIAICALGGSIATPRNGITAEVVEVKSLDEVAHLGATAEGKIVFFNRPMDPTLLETFSAYGGAVDQRGRGAVAAAQAGGVAALVRSMTLARDRVPHTGAMGYKEGVPKVPAASISTNDADTLSALLRREPHLKVRLEFSCRTLPDAPTANVMGEIVGSEHPEEIIAVGGHIDCWDKGSGAHDDGAGCVQAIEVLRLFKDLGIRPKRTLRAVMFMNEENGSRGGKAYASHPLRAQERHVAAIESDRGGFAPRGLTVQGDSSLYQKVMLWQPVFARLGADNIVRGHSGVDVGPIVEKGTPGFGLVVENHRYFDYHHSGNDTLDKVNARELETGAVVMAVLCYLLAEM
jgi:carboxypeptidase Q